MERKNPLYKLRYDRHITIPKLSKESGLSTKTIWKIEKCHIQRIKNVTLKKIADYFQIDGKKFLKRYLSYVKHHSSITLTNHSNNINKNTQLAEN